MDTLANRPKAQTAAAEPDLTKEELKRYFPLTEKPDPLLVKLATWNRNWKEQGEVEYGPQKPIAAVLGCSHSTTPATTVFGAKLNQLFQQVERGARLTSEKVGTLMYGLTHFKGHQIPFITIDVHACEAAQSCRKIMPDMPPFQHTSEVREASARLSITNLEGVAHLNLPGWQALAKEHAMDLVHGRSRSLLLLHNDKTLLKMVSDGVVVIGESFFDRSSGKVQWFGLVASKEIIANVATMTPSLEDILSGKSFTDDELKHLHPAFTSLSKLAHGNLNFQQTRKAPVPCRVVVLSCADGRAHPEVIYGGYDVGLIETFHSAGNEMDAHTLLGLKNAISETERHAIEATTSARLLNPDLPSEHKEHSYLLMKAHSRCGALNALVTARCGHDDHHHDPHGHPREESANIGHLVGSIKHRLDPYFSYMAHQNLDPIKDDPLGIIAARYNAFEACLDIHRKAAEGNPDAIEIVNVLKRGYVKLVPSVYLLKSGRVEFGEPLPAEVNLSRYDSENGAKLAFDMAV